jgi:hypothetical protein
MLGGGALRVDGGGTLPPAREGGGALLVGVTAGGGWLRLWD